MEEGFDTMGTYIWRMHNMVVQYIATWSIMDLCEVAERNQGAWVGMQLWEQAVIDLAGARETAEAAEEEEEDRM